MTSLDEIKEYLKERDIFYLSASDGSFIEMPWKIGERSIRIRAHVDCDGGFLFLRAGGLAFIESDSPAYLPVLAAIADANYRFRFVKASRAPDDGEVVMTGEVWVTDFNPTGDYIRDMIRHLTSALDEFIASIALAQRLDNPAEHEC